MNANRYRARDVADALAGYPLSLDVPLELRLRARIDQLLTRVDKLERIVVYQRLRDDDVTGLLEEV